MRNGPEPTQYETVAASQSNQLLGPAAAGRKGHYLHRLIITVATAATSTVSFKDGSDGSAIPVMAANTAIGSYSVDIGIRCSNETNPGFYVTTGAGVTVVAVGIFGVQV
jgi:hypothetical protein